MGTVIPFVELKNSREKYRIPLEGFGVAAMEPEKLKTAVSTAVEAGYRFFDNAPQYGNEHEVGTALKETGIAREELFISTKLPNYCHAYEDAIAACDRSLKALETDYLDMYMIHFPMPHLGLYTEAWRALEDLHDAGKVRVIGVSNFKKHHIEKILDMCRIVPMVNELELNPYYTQEELAEYCQKLGIHIINWFPLGGPKDPLVPYPMDDFKVLLEDEYLEELGRKYNKTTAQIALRWAVEHGFTPIPKSSNPQRIYANCDIFDFSLTAEEVTAMDALNHDRRLGPDSDEFTELFKPE